MPTEYWIRFGTKTCRGCPELKYDGRKEKHTCRTFQQTLTEKRGFVYRCRKCENLAGYLRGLQLL